MKLDDLYKVVPDTTQNNEINIKELKLVEEFVDEKYRRDTLTPKCEEFFKKIRAHFRFSRTAIPIVNEVDGVEIGNLPVMPVSFQELRKYGATLGHSEFAISQWMRMLWKAGKVRRFYVGYWNGALQGKVTGLKYGVHYLWI